MIHLPTAHCPLIPLSPLQATPRDVACKTQDGMDSLLLTTRRVVLALSGEPVIRPEAHSQASVGKHSAIF